MNYNQNVRKRKSGFIGVVVVTLIASAVAGGLFGDRITDGKKEGDLNGRLDEYTDLITAAKYWAATPIDSEKLVFSSIDGMLRTLDPHTTFLKPRDYGDMQDRQKGSFFGLGILITKRNNQITVITPLEGTPAARLGIRAGDIISEIEGESTEDMPVDEVVGKLKGPKGTKVNIKIVRIGIKEPIPLTIERAAIPTNSVTVVEMVRPDVGYVRLKDFTYTTVHELDQALTRLQEQGMKKLILDLRTNPGGLLDAAVGVADFFLDKGDMIVYHRGRTEDSYQEYRAPGKGQHLDVPLVVLINRESASASEIVAGAIQDHDRGLVLGQTSWGKGLVQGVFSLQYGAGLALTTSRYYTPSGRNIQRDYTSFYDYYLGEPGENTGNTEASSYETELGRRVFGGGGIEPDVMVEPRELPNLVQMLQVRSAIFNYAVEYVADHPETTRELVIGDEMLRDFAQFAEKSEIARKDEILALFASDPDSRGYVERQIKAEVVAAKFGYDASYPYRLKGDEQIEKAIQMMPEAEKLAESVRKVRHERMASAGAPRSGRETAPVASSPN